MKEEHVFEDHARFANDLINAGGRGRRFTRTFAGSRLSLGVGTSLRAEMSNHNALKLPRSKALPRSVWMATWEALNRVKLADFIILDKNPLENIRNTNTING